MAGRHFDTDVMVVGAGPAGCAAAIWCALHGLDVTILEGVPFPRHKPGETLHPGVEVILRSLGVHEAFAHDNVIRHRGFYVTSAKGTFFNAYGEDERGQWRGFQILRSDLDDVLLKKATSLGVQVFQPVSADAPLLRDGRVIGIRTTEGDYYAKFIVDGSGSQQWLRKALNLKVENHSPRLFVRYGYCQPENQTAEEPSFIFGEQGWTWKAKISPLLFQWTELTCAYKFLKQLPFKSTESFKIRGTDVTWRCIPFCAGPGYFLAGDAAVVLDPAASKGVMRALYSGVMAADGIIKILGSSISEYVSTQYYRYWLADWFHRDCETLKSLYREQGLHFTTWPAE